MRLRVDFVQGSSALSVRFKDASAFRCNFGQITDVSEKREHYDGAYDVVPGREETVLETKDCIMDDDVTVHPIPFYQVSNLSGGKTVYIGGPGEIEITSRRKTRYGKQ